MAKRVGDLTGKRFGNLTIKRLVGKDKYYDKIWSCECDCGNIIDVKQGHLRSGHTTSCGCNKFQLKSLVGERFTKLTVKERADDYVCPGTGKHYVQWRCLCDCGNETITITQNLVSGSIKSCGCYNPHKLQDLSGQKFGKLTVIGLVESYVNQNGRKLIRYECECECGNHILALANTLRAGDVMSCGCSVNSKGEKIVTDWLDKHNIKYKQHKSFDDCLSDSGYKLNFDFYLLDLNALIECNGVQHYEPIEFFGGRERFETQVKYDLIKKKYAESKNMRYLVLDCRKSELSSIISKLDDFFEC